MNHKKPESDWKLKLRYGKLRTPYKHFTILAEGRMERVENDFACPQGPAWMAMKSWASNVDECGYMIQSIGKELGFEITGKIEVYQTDPVEPPRDKPYGYDIAFTPFDDAVA